MTEPLIYETLLILWLAISAVTFCALLLISAPYGRHSRRGFGPTMGATGGWIVMEIPAVIAFVIIYAMGDYAAHAAPLVLLAMWQTHYIHRTFIFPFRRKGGADMPVSIVSMGVFFNLVNAYLNARAISHLSPQLSPDWFTELPFVVGVVLFFGGMAINITSDNILFSLRKPGEKNYKIPKGGFYRWVSCPNYMGELIEWFGWALATWSLGGLAFAIWTAANLVPRAIAHDRWYREKFPDYPHQRRAIVPFVL